MLSTQTELIRLMSMKTDTPKELHRFNTEYKKFLETIEALLLKKSSQAYDELFNYCPTMAELRPAKPDDIVLGAVIYYPKPDGESYWCVVEKLLHFADEFKAYICEGARYGLHNAHVRKGK